MVAIIKMGDIGKEEIWKNITISPYEDVYQISSFGRIKSLHSKQHKILKQALRSQYMGIQLNKNGEKKTESIHRLVALAFLENRDEKYSVNHKDGNKLNNNLENLEWNTPKENTGHAKKNNLHICKTLKISQFSLNNKLIKTYDSVTEAMKETGVPDNKICGVAKGKRKSAGGFLWKYTDFEYSKTPIPEGKILPEFPGYIITNDGKVYSSSHEKFLSSRLNSGYQYVTLYNRKEKTRKDLSIHYLVAKLYIDNLNNLPMVNHKNCDRSDNRDANLEWVTYSQNMKHKAKQRQNK